MLDSMSALLTRDFVFYILNFIILGFFFFVIGYYRDMYLTKEAYTKEEMFFFRRIIVGQLRALFGRISFIPGLFLYLVFAAFGGWMPLWGDWFGSNHDNWFFNSSGPFLIIYFIIPTIFGLELQLYGAAKKPVRDDSGGGEQDVARFRSLAERNFRLFISAFGLGYASHLFYNWGMYQAHPFWWSIGNGLLILWFSFQMMRRNFSGTENSGRPSEDSEKKEIVEKKGGKKEKTAKRGLFLRIFSGKSSGKKQDVPDLPEQRKMENEDRRLPANGENEMRDLQHEDDSETK